jgi:hypothetical protein
VDVVEWRSRIWNEALRSQGVEDMELARVKTAKQSLALFVNLYMLIVSCVI